MKEFFGVVNDALRALAELAKLAEPEVEAAFESETEVTTADLLLKAVASTDFEVESFERSKP